MPFLDIFWGWTIKISCLNFFQVLNVCNMNAKHVQTDQGYKLQRLLSDLDTYMSRYWWFWKSFPTPLKTWFPYGPKIHSRPFVLKNESKTRKSKLLRRGVLQDEFLHLWGLSGWHSRHFVTWLKTTFPLWSKKTDFS